MKKCKMTGTDLEVSALCLGTANYGTSTPQEEAFRQMSIFLENDGNIIDTAHVYGDWEPPVPGRSEKIIGRWMRETGKRSEVILVTKGCHPPIEAMDVSRVNAKSLHKDVEESLKNLRTDYIDLYFLHRDNPQISVGSLLEALEEERKKGNIRYYGCSNWSLPRVLEACQYAAEHGLQGFVCNQMMFSLADVVPETLLEPQLTILDPEFYQFHKETGLSFMGYMMLSGGYFAKRAAGREVSDTAKERYGVPSNDRILDKLSTICRTMYTFNDFVYQFTQLPAFPSIAVASFRNREQLEEGIRCMQTEIPRDLLEEVAALKELPHYDW